MLVRQVLDLYVLHDLLSRHSLERLQGLREVIVDVVYDHKSIRRTFYVEEIRDKVYAVILLGTYYMYQDYNLQ